MPAAPRRDRLKILIHRFLRLRRLRGCSALSTGHLAFSTWNRSYHHNGTKPRRTTIQDEVHVVPEERAPCPPPRAGTGSRFLVPDSKFQVPGSRYQILGSRFQVLSRHVGTSPRGAWVRAAELVMFLASSGPQKRNGKMPFATLKRPCTSVPASGWDTVRF